MKKVICYVSIICVSITLGMIMGTVIGRPLFSSELPTAIVSVTKNECTNQIIELTDMICKSQPKIDPFVATQIAKSVYKYSKEYKLPSRFILGMIKKESSFNTMALSNAKCQGLMQIHPTFHIKKKEKFNIKGNEIFYIDNNIRMGCSLFREFYDVTGSVEKALTKYYGANDIKYHYKVLSYFTDFTIKQTQKGEKADEVDNGKVGKISKS